MTAIVVWLMSPCQSERHKTELHSCSAEIEECERRTTVSAVVINQAFMVERLHRHSGVKSI